MDFVAMPPMAPTASLPPNPECSATLKSKSIWSWDNTPGVALDDSYVQDPISTQTVSIESDGKDKLDLNVQDLPLILEVENTQEEGHDFNLQMVSGDTCIVEDKGGDGKMDPVVVDFSKHIPKLNKNPPRKCGMLHIACYFMPHEQEDSASHPPQSCLPGPLFNEAHQPLEDLPPPTSLVDGVSSVSKMSKAGQLTLTIFSPSLKKQDDFKVTKPSVPSVKAQSPTPVEAKTGQII
ncbi:hypothetical protein GYMLUDRAFT_251735 [Collybiopsis luxurians FD-317 M1]|uniref:Uncharacterized protein n=1 Tax=Collybiopsis luxurians FD-317 M1 TaxID=944289 RepID=A0A0D0C1X0_9AGAR|nr:hypothetical protein GYMLUDRAFT_251735 [Collybiopsis luxurians FD-317 M1]